MCILSFLDKFVLLLKKYCSMNKKERVKKQRENNVLMQKGVYNEIGLKPFHYNKLEKRFIELSIDTKDKLTSIYGKIIDEIVYDSKETPKAVTIKDKTKNEQVKLIAQFKNKDKSTVMNIIDSILTKQNIQTYFEQNIQTAK